MSDTTTATGLPEKTPFDERLDELLDTWESAHARGEVLDVDALCPEDPRLAAALHQAINDLQRFEEFDNPAPFSAGDSMPQRIGSCQVIRELGAGGTSIVYLCRQRFPEREVAVKVLRSDVISARLLRRFRIEAQLLATLPHPGIVQIHHAGVINLGNGWQPYLIMEYVRGGHLGEVPPAIARVEKTAVDDVLRIFLKLATALEFAHQNGIIHRDLKPSNILIAEDGSPKLIDFGIARLLASEAVTRESATRTMVGTPPYMSPEQFRGEPALVDVRSDIYSLGVVLFESLTGVLPYDVDQKSFVETARIICETPPARLRQIDRRFDRNLESVLNKTLAKDPRDRYQSVREFADDLQRILSRQPVTAKQAGAIRQLWMWGRRNPTTAIVACVSAFLLAISASISGYTASLASQRARDLSDSVDELRLVNARLFESTDGLRRSAMNSTLMRAGMLMETDPTLSRALILDEGICPPSLRGYAWRLIEQHTRTQSLQIQATSAPLGSIGSLAFASDGAEIVTASPQFVRWWDAKEGSLIHSLQDAIGPKSRISAASRGNLVAVLRDDGIVFCASPSSATKVRLRNASRSRATAIACSDAGRFIAIGDETGMVEIWEAPFHTVLRRWHLDDAAIVALGFDATGTRCAAICQNGSIGEVNCDEVGDIERSRLPLEYILEASFSQNLAYVGTRDRESVILWDRRDSQVLISERRAHALALTHQNPPDLLVAVRNQVIQIDCDGLRRLLHSGKVRANSIAVSPNSNRLVVGQVDGSVSIHLEAPPPLHESIAAFSAMTYAACFSPDGSRLAVAGQLASGTHAVRVYDLADNELKVEFKGFSRRIHDMTFTQNTNRLIVCERGGSLALWDLEASSPIRKFELGEERLSGLTMSRDDRILFAGGQSTGAVLVYSLDENRPLVRLTEVQGHCRAVCAHQDGIRLFSVHAGGEICCWDTKSFKLLWRANCGEESIREAVLSSDGEWLVINPTKSNPKGWRLTSDGITPHLTLRTESSRAISIAPSPDGMVLVTGDQVGRVIMWDAASGQAQLELEQPHPSIECVRFSPDGRMLVACGRYGVTIWRIESPTLGHVQ